MFTWRGLSGRSDIKNLFFCKTRMRVSRVCINVLNLRETARTFSSRSDRKTQVKQLNFRIDLRFEVDRIDKISIRFM